MLARPRIDKERFSEWCSILSKIPGASRKTWHWEFYLRDGRISQVIDLKTGKVIRNRKEPKNKRQGAPG